MSKLAETIIHDIIDELTDWDDLASVWFNKFDENRRKLITGTMVGIVDQNIKRLEELK